MSFLSGIYKILNVKTNKFYIGSSFNLNKREKTHFDKLNKNDHGNPHLQKSFNKHGKDNFKFQVIEIVPRYKNETKLKFRKRLVYEKEQHYLDTLLYAQEYIRNENNKFLEFGYNINPTASSTLGRKFANRKSSPLSEEHKNNISLNAKNNPNYGFSNRTHTDETNEINKLKHIGKTHSEESKKKISINHSRHNLGKTFSEETKQKISNSKKGSIPWNKGKKGVQKCSEETKLKSSEHISSLKWYNDGIKNYRLVPTNNKILELNLKIGRLSFKKTNNI